MPSTREIDAKRIKASVFAARLLRLLPQKLEEPQASLKGWVVEGRKLLLEQTMRRINVNKKRSAKNVRPEGRGTLF